MVKELSRPLVESKEHLTPSKQFSARLVLAGYYKGVSDNDVLRALNPSEQVSIPDYMDPYSISTIGHVINPFSHKERREYWKDVPEADKKWSEQMAVVMKSVSPDSERARVLKDIFGIHVDTFTKEDGFNLLNNSSFFRVQDGKRTSDIDEFFRSIARNPRYGGKDGQVNMLKDKEHLVWFTNIYGQKTAKMLDGFIEYLNTLWSDIPFPTDISESVDLFRTNKGFLDATRNAISSHLQEPLSSEDELLLSQIANTYVDEHTYLRDTVDEEDAESLNAWLREDTLSWMSKEYTFAAMFNDFVKRNAIPREEVNTMLEQIGEAVAYEETEIAERYKGLEEGERDAKRYLWKKQDKYFTCTIAAAGNALRSLYGRDSEEFGEDKFIDALGGEAFVESRRSSGISIGEAEGALKDITPQVLTKKSSSLSEVLDAVEKGASALVEVKDAHEGTIPAGAKVFRQNGILMIPVIDPELGVIDVPVNKLLRSSVIGCAAIGYPDKSSYLILQRKDSNEEE